MDYERSLRFSGDREVVLSALLDGFLQQGFTLAERHADAFVVTGPGLQSTRQPPIQGVSRAEAVVGGADVTLRAELGGVRRMQYFLLLFPPALILGLAAFFFFAVPRGELFLQSSAPALLLSWLVIGLFMGMWIKRRTTAALDVLLANAVALETPPVTRRTDTS